MNTEVEAAFSEMLDISTDIDKAVVFASGEVVASNIPSEKQAAAMAQALELIALGEARAKEMGSQPLSQLVVETPSGFVFLAREPEVAGLSIMATGKKGSRVGLALYDLKTCLRDAREALGAVKQKLAEGEEF